ncbi:MAG: ABC transporter ATP-binding protein [Oscillospiraceae bacterium]|jgi:ATP-binding cassette subfamily B multidrug efflux pump
MKNSGVLKIVRAVLAQNRGKTAFLAAAALVSVLLSLAPPQIMCAVIDRCLTPGVTEGLWHFAILYVAVIILAGTADFLKGWLLTFFGQHAIHAVRAEMMAKLARLPAHFFTDNAPGQISSRVMTDVSNINVLFSDGIVSMVVDSLKIIGIIVSIWLFSARLGLIALALLPLVFFITRFFKKRMYAAQVKNLEQLGRVNSRIAESIGAVFMVKLFCKERYMEEKYCRELRANYETNGRVILYDSVYAPIIQAIRAVVIALVVLLASDQVSVLGISVGALAATIDLMSQLLAPVEALGMEIQNIQKGLSGIGRIDEFLTLPEDEKDLSITAEKTLASLRGNGAVRFENLRFRYDDGTDVLKGISAAVAENESVTITGRTGVGKTTLFSLVMGLLRPTEGRVCIGKYDASAIPDSEKRRVFGYVEQRFRFVPGTVAEQITLGDPDISRERVEEVCRAVGLDESIRALPEGYDTKLSGSGTFSWGQCQLLSIARAVAADPKILLLDEITANLDSATEAHVMDSLQSVSAGRTVLAISHREGAVRHADRVLHIQDGKLI